MDGGSQQQSFAWTDEALATLAQRRAAGESVAEIRRADRLARRAMAIAPWISSKRTDA